MIIQLIIFVLAYTHDSGYPEPPLFLERFEEMLVKQKGVILLKARVIGNPVPEISWLKDNRQLHPSDRVQLSYDGENIQLLVPVADSESDTGDYKCIATNSFGRASHGARITVDVDEVCFTKPLKKNISIEETQKLVLECETSHTISTTWLHNGKEITGMDYRQIIESGRSHKLIIKTTNMKDAGEYTCQVKSKETHTTVEVLERYPEFLRRLEDIDINEGDNGVLEVEVSSESAEVIWKKDEQIIATNERNRFEVVASGCIRKLIIRSASIHDEGEYSCLLGDQECNADVNIIESPPKIIKPLHDTTCTTGDTAIFDVELSKGDALVKWFKDNAEITFNDLIRLSIDGKKQCLAVKTIDTNDSGIYSCKVGHEISEAKLTVEEPMVSFITKLPKITLSTLNADVQLKVELSNPNVEVTWLKNGRTVETNDKFELNAKGPVRTLIIHSVDDDDISEYSCTAQNVKTTTKLKVEGSIISLST